MENPGTPDRMLVAMFDVTGMSVSQVRSLEASLRNYANVRHDTNDRYVSTNVYNGGPVSLRVCAVEPLTGFPEDEGRQAWKPVEEAAL